MIASSSPACLPDDVELFVDTGGAVPLHAHTARGRVAVAELIQQILSGFARPTLVQHEMNGGLGILMKDDGVLVGVLNFATEGDAISRIWAVLNPDKLIRFDVD